MAAAFKPEVKCRNNQILNNLMTLHVCVSSFETKVTFVLWVVNHGRLPLTILLIIPVIRFLGLTTNGIGWPVLRLNISEPKGRMPQIWHGKYQVYEQYPMSGASSLHMMSQSWTINRTVWLSFMLGIYRTPHVPTFHCSVTKRCHMRIIHSTSEPLSKGALASTIRFSSTQPSGFLSSGSSIMLSSTQSLGFLSCEPKKGSDMVV